MRTIRTSVAILGLALTAAILMPTFAAEGRTPIWQPTVISNPGKYIVTRDIVAAGGAILIIDADHVDINLNGFRLESAGGPDPVIISGSFDNTTIRNGSLVGGSGGVQLPGGRNHVIEDVKVLNTGGNGIELDQVGEFALRRNQVVGAVLGITVKPVVGDRTTGIIENNQVSECQEGIFVDGGASVIIRDNRIWNVFGGIGLHVNASSSVLVAKNTVQDIAAEGIVIESSQACKLYNNVVNRAAGPGIVLAATNEGLLLDNVVNQVSGDGIFVDGERNHIERNVLNGNGTSGAGYGLILFGPGNVYRGNTARGNAGPAAACAGAPATSDICDTIAGSSSFGDNFMPFLL